VIAFAFTLDPHATWHGCIDVVPVIDGEELPPEYRCRSFVGGAGLYDSRRQDFMREASTVTGPASGGLTTIVIDALERAKRERRPPGVCITKQPN
jgi:hypothetical protein